MSRLSVIAIGLCAIINMMDGYDILIIAFGAPSIKMAWNLSNSDVGLLFSAGLGAMGLGGITLAPLADVFGRRRTILLCLLLTATGMFLGAAAGSFGQLALWRFVTGLGVGGMMPAINTVVSEYATDRWRAPAIVVQATGYPVGGALGGLLAIHLLGLYGWRSLLLSGGAFSSLLIVPALLWIPESLEYLINRRPADALTKVNNILQRSNMPGLCALPEPTTRMRGVAMRAVFSADLARVILPLCAATFLVQFTFYFVINWAPILLGTSVIASSIGMSGAVLLNSGGIVGDLLFGLLCLRASPRRLGTFAMTACFGSIVLFVSFPHGTWLSLSMAFLIGCFLFASMASIYAIAPSVLPPLARSTGTGLALSVGRVGATIGPTAGAVLLSRTLRPSGEISVLLAAPLILAGLLLFLMREDHCARPQ